GEIMYKLENHLADQCVISPSTFPENVPVGGLITVSIYTQKVYVHNCILLVNGANNEERLAHCNVMFHQVFNDPIHGHVELHPLLCKIIDTPQFQRLRNIKQLGGAYYVYPGASHNRFEHSIGVAHLAGQFARALKERQPELRIKKKDILCVEVAGLCHDLGHGPFSHLFDGNFIPKACPGRKWKHEKASIAMFNHLMKNKGVKSAMEKYRLDEKDRDFIKEMIFGPLKTKTSESMESKEWPYKGRTKDKSFLYEIVSNKRNVDCLMDSLHLGMKNSFDHCRFIKFARVCKVAEDGEWQICIRDKEVSNIYEMFHTRSRLHRRAYQHKTNKIIELMITEAFVKADKHICRKGSKGKTFTLSETIKDMEAYTKLTDHIFDEILNSSSDDLKEAREILQKVITRKLYPYLGQTKPKQNQDITEGFTELKRKLAEVFDGTRKQGDFKIIVSKIDFGMKHKNPIDNLRFYKKDEPDKAFKISDDQVSDFVLPSIFSEQWIRVYWNKSLSRKELKAAREIFENWRQKIPHPEVTFSY
uniref:HD domain-containing protein n=1 Tax=Sphaeramia orbicularis TaxID=375764 RepID=A0A673B5M9_9TELE